MKKQLFRMSLLAVAIIIAACSDKQSNPVESEPSSEDKSVEIGRGIDNKFFYNYETDETYCITFSTWGHTNTGSCIFREGSVFKGNECRFMYSFIIQDEKIEAKFLNSDCHGRTTTDRTFYYDQSRDVISTIVNGQTFEFAPDGNPYQKKKRRSI